MYLTIKQYCREPKFNSSLARILEKFSWDYILGRGKIDYITFSNVFSVSSYFPPQLKDILLTVLNSEIRFSLTSFILNFESAEIS